jgi:hypothetical protein
MVMGDAAAAVCVCVCVCSQASRAPIVIQLHTVAAAAHTMPAASSAAAASPGVNVLFSVSGEMGLSNYVFAPAWRGVLRDARARLQRSGWKV